jgi:aspartyl protease family protein
MRAPCNTTTRYRLRRFRDAATRLLFGPLTVIASMPLAQSADIQVIGVFGNKATLVIDGGRPRTLATGESTPEKIRLIGVTADSAIVEADGKRQTVPMGQRISSGAAGGAQRVTITADAKGHFFIHATVNGVSMPFMVDTGATMITISSNHAKSAGIAYTMGERSAMQTANGVTSAFRVKLDTVRIGDITLNNVDGIVVESQQLGSFGLLGMSFLNRTEMRRDGDLMTLTRRY